ncbi:hypothetical protein LPJ53_001562 [Coemansia erecta]|uniref:Galactose oxidase n=1 Tax=Coemansia erecta TaxID=147472 RepID=A0A9W8CS17_9FUNG|nr:hypothetical protein LPJ53_001562 [Coemansia erecta]
MHSRLHSIYTVLLVLGTAANTYARLVSREGNLNETQAVSDPTSAWRAFACMVPFTASDNTPLLMLYGGTSDSQASDPLSVASSGMSKLQVFDTNNNKWYAPNTANAPKTGPVLPGCGAASGNIWVYDSQYGVAGKDSTAVSLLDSVHWSWSAPTEQGQLPVTRFGAAFAYVPSTNAFYMHGGIPLSDDTNTADDPPGIANNVDILAPSTISWSYASNGPARKYHTMCYMSSIDALVMFGGSDMDVQSYNDVKVLTAKNNLWNYAVSVSGDLPAERILHSTVCSDDTMYMYGGLHSISDSPSDSAVWLLKASSDSSFTWSRAPVVTGDGKSSGPTARAGHAAALYNNSMYIYGGIGPSGQDATMYKLDLGSWEWSQTNVTGSSADTQKEKKAKTAVLIAAIVSSVLGIITIGIAATVIYRFVRRRRRGHAFGAGAARRQSDSDDSSDDEVAAMSEQKFGSRRGTGTSMHHGAQSARDSGAYDNTDVSNSGGGTADQSPAFISPSSVRSSGIGFGLPLVVSTSSNSHHGDLIMPVGASSSPDVRAPVDLRHATSDDTNFTSVATTPASIATERELLPASDKSLSTGSRMLNTMRAHARSLSTRMVPSRLSVAFSDHTVAVPHSPSTSSAVAVSRKYRADTVGSSYVGPRRKSTIIDQSTANELYGRDYSRLENEYRQAEAINQILLSGQPIPAWLRDAVSQAESESREQPSSHAAENGIDENSPDRGTAAGSYRGRKLGIANTDMP